ncbi:MAG: gliding motility protein GldC [Saprospiraceae bacterium]
MADEVIKESEIRIKIGLNEEKMPVALTWESDDDPQSKTPQPCKGMLLSLFSARHKETLKIDLWTKDMQVLEMDRFFYQTLRGLADTYFRATQNKQVAEDMQRFVQYFGEQTGAVPKDKDGKIK